MFAWRVMCAVLCPALGLLLGVTSDIAHARSLSAQARSRLDAGQGVNVIVELDVTAIEVQAANERGRRKLNRDDAAIRTFRRRGYVQLKDDLESRGRSGAAMPVRDFDHLPMSVWRLTSAAALQRLAALPGVRAIHEDVSLHPVSVSDLGFINQPQTAALGKTGAGTVVAVIDGGLGSNYLSYSDFGTCTAVNTPAGTCRVVYNQDFYPGASAGITHGTNVSAIALGVAPGSKLAMYNVFNGAQALTSDLLGAMNDIVSRYNASTFNVAAVNLSLGDGSSHATQCGSSNQFNANYSAFNAPVNALKNLGIITVAAAGNSGSKTGLADPACVPGVVSVGAVYDASYGSLNWGVCTDSSATDHVTCFSQSAAYLTLLAPGTFVNAPNASFQQSGTSQATPHVTGSVAVLRAEYPAEAMMQTIKRLTDTGVIDTDQNASNRTTPRLNLLAAVNEALQLRLTGSGPATATSGGTGTYAYTAINDGPLTATNVRVVFTLPTGAAFSSGSSGCTAAAGKVTCVASNIAANASTTFNINVQWSVSGAVYAVASVAADQIDSASAAQQQVAIGIPPDANMADAPLPAWARILLVMMLAGSLHVSASQRQRGTTYF